ncbi:dihydrofolate reductase [Luteibaculum oceani]|uniref:Dihydrofolate reductase n=1 Tax=Luteibaculum oceani TaxID=1294296 RepID=A0A5C6UXW5_9FLAO|nr:dihydrofolate reductase [Luteibaculum oceani]TXC78323.1 dihydrofolate reductase [Luteibaculum oceani]
MRFLAMIAAVGTNNVIGSNNDLMWHLPNDFRFFKKTTTNRVVVMGRKTYESMDHALPHRYNFVLTNNREWNKEDARVFSQVDEMFEHAYKIDKTPFVIGGAQIYKQFLNKATHLFITRVDFSKEGEAYFPEFSESDFELLKERKHPSDEKHAYPFTIQIWQRRGVTPKGEELDFLNQQIENL